MKQLSLDGLGVGGLLGGGLTRELDVERADNILKAGDFKHTYFLEPNLPKAIYMGKHISDKTCVNFAEDCGFKLTDGSRYYLNTFNCRVRVLTNGVWTDLQ